MAAVAMEVAVAAGQLACVARMAAVVKEVCHVLLD